jgi:hypothetical protein
MKQVTIANTQTFSGQGPVMAAKIVNGVRQGFRQLGDVEDLALSLKTTVNQMKEHVSGQRGLLKREETEKGLDLSFKLVSTMDDENLAMGMRASYEKKNAGTVTDEAHLAFAGCIVPTRYISITDDVTLVVKSADGLTTYDKGDDYTVYDHGIEIVEGGAIGTADTGDGIAIKISYGYAAQTVFQGLTEAAAEYCIRFEGLNTSEDNKPVIVEVFKVGTDVLKQFGMIVDKSTPMEISGSAIMDVTRTTGSKFFELIKG